MRRSEDVWVKEEEMGSWSRISGKVVRGDSGSKLATKMKTRGGLID